MSLEAYQRARGSESRQSILSAATSLFAERGFERSSLAQVAKRAGVSSATVYKHFPSKLSLFESVLDALAQTELPRVESLTRAGLQHFAMAYAELLLEDRTSALLRLLIAEAPHHPDLTRAFYERLKGPLFRPLAILAEPLGAEDAAVAARQLAGLVEGHLLLRRLLAPGETIPDAHVVGIVHAAMDTWWGRWGPRL